MSTHPLDCTEIGDKLWSYEPLIKESCPFLKLWKLRQTRVVSNISALLDME